MTTYAWLFIDLSDWVLKKDIHNFIMTKSTNDYALGRNTFSLLLWKGSYIRYFYDVFMNHQSDIWSWEESECFQSDIIVKQVSMFAK